MNTIATKGLILQKIIIFKISVSICKTYFAFRSTRFAQNLSIGCVIKISNLFLAALRKPQNKSLWRTRRPFAEISDKHSLPMAYNSVDLFQLLIEPMARSSLRWHSFCLFVHKLNEKLTFGRHLAFEA